MRPSLDMLLDQASAGMAGATLSPTMPRSVRWGAANAQERGPIIATTRDPWQRNVIGAHGGSYAVYRALAVAAGTLSADHRPDLTNTAPSDTIGPHLQWTGDKIVSLDPWGHLVEAEFHDQLARGVDVRPSIAITRAHIDMPEIRAAFDAGRIRSDGEVVLESGQVRVTKIAIEPVWYMPGVAARFNISETDLRRNLFDHTGGMYPELMTRPDIKVFLPPIGGSTVYCFGDPAKLGNRRTPIACRVHDECNGSDVFSSDICTCRPYLAHGIEMCIETAQAGGVGVVVYNRKEGRALGEVTKFLVYNARKRQVGGDRPESYFRRTECVAGVEDMRFQELMPDTLHWLGITRIDRLASMSDMKHDALVSQDIAVGERVPIPESMIPADARVEMEAKIAAGYYSGNLDLGDDTAVVGRGLAE